jgi:hypothetical protein
VSTAREVGGGVRRQIDDRLGCVGPAAPALPLVELHDEVAIGIEQSPCPRAEGAPRPAVEEHGRLPGRIAGRLPVHEVSVADVEVAAVERLRHRMWLHP